MGKSTTSEVMGHIYMFKVTDPNFYDKDRIVRVGALSVNSPNHTLATEDKIFARYNYQEVQYMGNFDNKTDPDAYIFKGKKVLDDAKLRVLHHYRIINPICL